MNAVLSAEKFYWNSVSIRMFRCVCVWGGVIWVSIMFRGASGFRVSCVYAGLNNPNIAHVKYGPESEIMLSVTSVMHRSVLRAHWFEPLQRIFSRRLNQPSCVLRHVSISSRLCVYFPQDLLCSSS